MQSVPHWIYYTVLRSIMFQEVLKADTVLLKYRTGIHDNSMHFGLEDLICHWKHVVGLLSHSIPNRGGCHPWVRGGHARQGGKWRAKIRAWGRAKTWMRETFLFEIFSSNEPAFFGRCADTPYAFWQIIETMRVWGIDTLDTVWIRSVWIQSRLREI